MATVITITLIILAIAAIVWFAWPRPAFVVAVQAGTATVQRGRPNPEFVEDCQRICHDAQITRGRIAGVRQSGRISLRFSHDIPSDCHQRFRNAMAFHTR